LRYLQIQDTGADPGFQVRGYALKKIAPSGGRHENCWAISCEKSRFYTKKSYFSSFRGGARRVRSPWIRPWDRPISKPHNIWQSTGNDRISIKSGEIKSKLVTQSYMLQNIKSRYNKKISSICTLCETGDEDIYHFLLVCSSLKSTRERHLQKIQEYLDSLRNGLYQDIHDADMLVQLLMDCTSQEINYGIRIKQQQYIVYGNGKPK
jgi:hypothetical protein